MLSSREFCRAASGKASGSDNRVRTLKYSVVITPFIILTYNNYPHIISLADPLALPEAALKIPLSIN